MTKAVWRGAGVEDLGDGGVVHHGQGLPLGLEAGHDLLGVHALLDDLEGDLAFDGLLLLGQPDLSHAALAELLEQAVGTDLLGTGGGARSGVRLAQLGGVQFGAVVVTVVVGHEVPPVGWKSRYSNRRPESWCLGPNVSLPRLTAFAHEATVVSW
jgi:hypothetical protein